MINRDKYIIEAYIWLVLMILVYLVIPNMVILYIGFIPGTIVFIYYLVQLIQDLRNFKK